MASFFFAAPPLIDPCQDAIADCARYGVSSCSGQYTDWAKINCQRFCQFCQRKLCSLSFEKKPKHFQMNLDRQQFSQHDCLDCTDRN